MDGDGFIDLTPDDPVEAARFLSFLDLSPILAVLGGSTVSRGAIGILRMQCYRHYTG